MTLETILRPVLCAVAWSAFVTFCGVVAGVGVRWMLRRLGDALSETMRRHGKWAAMTLASLALVCGVVGDKNATNEPPNGVSAPAPMMSCAMETIAPPVDWAQSSPAGALSLGAQSSRLRERPATARNVPQWELRGAYDDTIRIPAEGWDTRRVCATGAPP